MRHNWHLAWAGECWLCSLCSLLLCSLLLRSLCSLSRCTHSHMLFARVGWQPAIEYLDRMVVAKQIAWGETANLAKTHTLVAIAMMNSQVGADLSNNNINLFEAERNVNLQQEEKCRDCWLAAYNAMVDLFGVSSEQVTPYSPSLVAVISHFLIVV